MGKVLVLAAHPDDEVLGCGGTLLRWRRQGQDIRVVFAGEGREGGSQVDEAQQVAQHAGWRIGEFGTFVDNAFGPIKALTCWIEDALASYCPDRVLIHSAHELNQDHQAMHQASLIACRAYGAYRCITDLWSFEVPGSTTSAFRPTLFSPIEADAEAKHALVRLYASESRPFPHPRSVEALQARAVYWGSHAWVRAAEAFLVERQVLNS